MGDYSDLLLMAFATLTLITWLHRVPKKLAGYLTPSTPQSTTPAPGLPGVPQALTQALANAVDRKAVGLEGPLSATHADPDELQLVTKAVLNRVQAAAAPGEILPVFITVESATVLADTKGNRSVDVCFVTFEAHSLTTLKVVGKIVIKADGEILVLELIPHDTIDPENYAVESKCARSYASYEPVVSPII